MPTQFNDVRIRFGGKDYIIKPTYEMARRVESPIINGGLGISIAGMAARAGRGEVAITEVSDIVALMLRSAGAVVEIEGNEFPVTGEDVYGELLTIGDSIAVINAVTLAFFPAPKVKTETTGADKKK
jgi:hypothetical protein